MSYPLADNSARIRRAERARGRGEKTEEGEGGRIRVKIVVYATIRGEIRFTTTR